MKQDTLVARELLRKGLWRCPGCREIKVLETSFYTNRASRTGYASHCMVCANQLGRENGLLRKKYYARDKQKTRDRILRAKFGISLEDYDRLFKIQNYGCAICGGLNSDRALAVDHNHKTGQVRGLLCSRCNAAIGFLQEDTNRALKAIEYIRRYNGIHEN